MGEDVNEAIERIERYTDEIDETGYLSNEMLQDAVVRNLEVIGEASNNIEKYFPQFSSENPGLPLSYAYQMRNALAHGYFKVDHEIVWRTISNDLPDLYVRTQGALGLLRNDLESDDLSP